MRRTFYVAAIVAFWLFGSIWHPANDVFAASPLYMSFSSNNMAEECSDLPRACYAEGRQRFTIFMAGIPHYLEEGWPAGLTIDAGQLANDLYVPSANLTNILNITRFIDMTDRDNDSLWRTGGPIPTEAKGGPRFQFYMTIPASYVGQRIYFRAMYHSPDSVYYTNQIYVGAGDSTVNDFITVVSPCSDSTTQKAQGTFVDEANLAGNYERAMQIADSLIALGWRDFAGLYYAIGCAGSLGRWTDALRYLDLNWEVHHRSLLMENILITDTARFHYEDSLDYVWKRENFLRLIEEQEQR